MGDMLKSKIAIVTGSARGIGFSVAEKLAENGAKVIITDVFGDQVEEAEWASGSG